MTDTPRMVTDCKNSAYVTGTLSYVLEQVTAYIKEYGPDAKIDFDNFEHGRMLIVYKRPETEEEKLKREAVEAADSKARRDRDLRMLATLKAKYGE